MLRIIITFLMVFVFPFSISVKNLQNESWYQYNWCMKNGGVSEYVLPDRTRCDCLTDKNAIEFDFAKKWTEAIGQSLYYAMQTGKRAGIVLIIEKETDKKYWIRMNSVIQQFNLPIDTWEVSQ